MESKKLITSKNREISSRSSIDYIVIHYVGAVSSAHDNAKYFEKEYRGASAHYFIDDNECWQVVEEKDIAWHSGIGIGESYNHPYCRNYNSIGIEMCCKMDDKNNLIISDETRLNTMIKTAEIMSRYDIPIDNVLRHYDVSWKLCPRPWTLEHVSKWYDFLCDLGNMSYLEPWQFQLGKSSVDKLIEKGLLNDKDWIYKLDEFTPNWLLFSMMDRVTDKK